MRFIFTREVHEFLKRAGPFIEPRVECNVMATVVENVLDGVYSSQDPLFVYGLEADDEVVFAALRTPPWSMLASGLDAEAALELVGRWLEADPELPGVNSVPDTAGAISAAWKARTAGRTRCLMREAMHTLNQVQDPPRPARGRLRHPEESERDLLVLWMEEFSREARVQGADQAEAIIANRLARGTLMVWDDGGPVSMVGWAGPVAGVARIGPVYTPPAHRRQGFASSAVAESSRIALARGAHTCMLYTDLANPTSNKIYAQIGYRRVADWEEHVFVPR